MDELTQSIIITVVALASVSGMFVFTLRFLLKPRSTN